MRVRIYKPAKSAMQSGTGNSRDWLLEPELLTAREPDNLMGWVSASDTNSELRGKLQFATQAEAEAFADHHGWEKVVEVEPPKTFVPKNYLDNFRIIRAQDEEPHLQLAVKKNQTKGRPAT